jgi:hypothetical protein
MSLPYTPRSPYGAMLPDGAQFLLEELQRIAATLRTLQDFDVLTVPPEKPRRGLVVYADGTSWNPGSGEGVYRFNGTIWVFLG